ncbi:hypothetical protein DICPUDRAFT_96905 [Dictyostelium purpureum]|uniref:Auto-transporter adhesin head GIN domain-containing protein n=1 Tax=Dictyostelium purpureum TaxID=5786 RepID=F0ZC56_DICPU|nr:uncharacterized protein DICPUDRAFT_96905 [Dictyostelium purpureum]EGC38437.1 hypothetical protein DICPUDRAFT_96905 [Dictyostelium purpureum]|eukprot:XP_003284995.1 hypothetical protein DICPUDRAFT_96905 [Dictyostelium purpureum]
MNFNNKTLAIIFLISIIIINTSCAVTQFNNSQISNCKDIEAPCNLQDSVYWNNNKLPSDGDDIIVDFSTLIASDAVNIKNQLLLSTFSNDNNIKKLPSSTPTTTNLVYLFLNNLNATYNSLNLVGYNGGADNITISLVFSNIQITVEKLNLTNSYLNLINASSFVKVEDKLILSNNSVFNITQKSKLQVDGVAQVDSSSFLNFYNESTLSLNGESIFKSSPLFQNNSTLINSNDPSTVYFHSGVKSYGNAVLSNCQFYKSSYFLGNVSVDGIVDLVSNSTSASSISVYGNLDVESHASININNGSVLSLGGKINGRSSLDSENNNLFLNGGTLEIVNSNSNFSISNYTSNNEQSYGSIYFIQVGSNGSSLELSSSIVGFNNSNINVGVMGSALYIINSTFNSFYEDGSQVANGSLISTSNVTINSLHLHFTKLVIEEESTFILGGNAIVDSAFLSYSENNIDTMGNFIITNTNIQVPLINLIDKMESLFYLINSNLYGSLNVTDNKFYPVGVSTVSKDLYVGTGGEIVFDRSNTQLIVGGNLYLQSNSVLYIQDNNSNNNLIKINGNLTIAGKLVVNIKWTNKIKSSDYSLKLFELDPKIQKQQVNGVFNDGISILFNGASPNDRNRVDGYRIKVDSSYVSLEIPYKKLPKWYIHVLVIGILCVIGFVAGLIYAIAGINNALKYYAYKRREEKENISLPLLKNKDNTSTGGNKEDKENKKDEDLEKVPLKKSKNNIVTNNIIITSENNNSNNSSDENDNIGSENNV